MEVLVPNGSPPSLMELLYRWLTLNMALPGQEHKLVYCNYILERDEQTSYVSVLVLFLSRRYYISLWSPIGS